MPLSDAELAVRHAPQLMLDRQEPYRPLAFGYSVFRAAGQSPSSAFFIEPGAATVIEYAIYYDWDIGHLYDLEHVWVHVGEDGAVTKVEASAHGGRNLMDAGGGGAEMLGPRPVVYVEAGKHAHWAAPEQMDRMARWMLKMACGPLAGIDGVLVSTPLGEAGAYTASPRDHRLARLKMQAEAFEPAYAYEALATLPRLMPWPELAALIPQRIRAELAGLEESMPHFSAIFLDCGDTLIDEGTEVKDGDVVLSGALVPGAREMVLALKAAGHRLILVADGPRQSFLNLLPQHGLWEHFDAHIISGDVGAEKPDARMFDAALAAAGLTRADAWRTVMVGNNLSRDISGANALGITSIFMAWSGRRSHVPADAGEVPDYRIATPMELPGLLAQLEPLLRYHPLSGA